MVLYVEHLSDQNFKSELEKVLANKKSFQRFNHKIDLSNFRQSWFDFNQKELEKRVENELCVEILLAITKHMAGIMYI